MKSKLILKVLSLFLVLSFVVGSLNITALAEESTTIVDIEEEQVTEEESSVTVEEAQKTLEEQRAELEEKLKENQEKLDSFSEDAKNTAEYIDALDEKIGYLNDELSLLDAEIIQAENNIEILEPEITSLKEELKELNAECTAIQNELDSLDDSYQATYDLYCARLRAIYISGSDSVISLLLTSSDLSEFYYRLQMIKAISNSDTTLLQTLDNQMNEIVTKQNGLNEQKELLESKKKELDEKQTEFENDKKTIEVKQQEAATKKVELSDKRAESDALLAKYSAETQMYTEFRNEDQELIDAVDQEIDDLLNGLISPDEIGEFKESDKSNYEQTIDYGDASSLYSNSNAVLNLCYPVPNHKSVSQDYGYYSNGKPHTGIDYPCPKGSKVVAAQKGIVITVKRLDYSYGYYVMIYHGTDAKGRKIVTLYAHNSSILVSVGQTVKKGEQIAKSGSTGNSTGPHCHFELIMDGSKVNPKYYLG